MILYHGSNVFIDNIDLTKSKPYKDFGMGFYLSDNFEQAHVMAQFKSMAFGGAPVVNSFYFDESLLHDGTLRFLHFDGYSAEWADFIFKNRNEAINFQHDYDVVYGPIANDRIGLQIQKLEDGSISFEEFLNRIKYFKGITYQYFFGTELSIAYLKKK